MWDVLILSLAVVMLLCFWIILFDSNRFVVRHMSVSDPRIKGTYRVIVLSDLHNKCYGKENKLLLEKIREQQPDAVFIAGDMLTAKPKKSMEAAITFMRALAAEYPVFYGNGNHEHRLKLYPEKYGDMAEVYGGALSSMGVKPLVNEGRYVAEHNIEVYGAEIDREYYRRFTVPQMEERYLEKLLGKADKERYICLLAHNPDYFPAYARWGADFVCSGHVHGGMVRIPFWRGIVSPNVRLFPKYDGGIFREGEATMLLSRGLGMHTIPIRMFNPGELIVVEFQEKASEVV